MRNAAEVLVWSDEGLDSWPGEIVINGSLISVSYDADGYLVTYKGKEVEPGHYRLWCRDPEIDGEATLHAFAGSRILEGFWLERASGSGEGMWRVRLQEVTNRSRLPERPESSQARLAPIARKAIAPGPVFDWSEVDTMKELGRGHGLELEHDLVGAPVAFIPGYPLTIGSRETIQVRILARRPRRVPRTVDWPTVMQETRQGVAALFTPDEKGLRRPRHGQRVGRLRLSINA